MNADVGFERLIASWLASDGPQTVPDGLVDAALARARRLPQERVPLSSLPAAVAERAARATPRSRAAFLILAAALTAALALGALLAVGQHRGLIATPGLIAYSVDGRLVVAKPDGSDPRGVSGTGAFSRDPRWAPDGRHLAFWTGAAGDAPLDLVVVDANGSSPHVVIPARRSTSEPAWSPDSRRVVVNTLDPSVPSAGFAFAPLVLTVADVETSAAVRLDTRGLNPRRARWSPTGDLIALWGEGLPDDTGLYVIAPDGTGLRRVAPTSCAEEWFCFEWIDWSPDGTTLAFSAGDSYVHAIWTAEIDGGEPAAISSDGVNANNPTWSPDGALLAWFESDEPFGLEVPTSGRIVVANADGSGATSITSDLAIPFATPRWSPDGRSILAPVLNASTGIPDRLGRFPIAGGPTELLSLGGHLESEPSWQRRP